MRLIPQFLTLTVCFGLFPIRSLAQSAPAKQSSPRCCYPIISTVNNKIGFIDETGRLVVPPTFVDELSIEFISKYKFSEGLAAVEVKVGESERDPTKCGFIDKKGTFVIAPTYLMALDFSEGLAAVQVEVEKDKTKWGFIDKKGNMIIAPTYSGALSFSGGLAPVKTGDEPEVNDKWGFIDHEGHLKIAPAYSDAPDLYDFNGNPIHTATTAGYRVKDGQTKTGHFMC